MSPADPVPFRYLSLSAQSSTPAPYVEGTVSARGGTRRLAFLLDTGADRSALPDSMAARLGVEDLLEPASVLLGSDSWMKCRGLRSMDHVEVTLDGLPATPIAPYFMPRVLRDDGTSRESKTCVLGRDFALWHSLCFEQLEQVVHITPGDHLLQRAAPA